MGVLSRNSGTHALKGCHVKNPSHDSPALRVEAPAILGNWQN